MPSGMPGGLKLACTAILSLEEPFFLSDLSFFDANVASCEANQNSKDKERDEMAP